MTDASRIAFENLVTERLNATHPDTDPNRCAHCGKPETSAAILLPIGWGAPNGALPSTVWACDGPPSIDAMRLHGLTGDLIFR